jgi:hypothetical protein
MCPPERLLVRYAKLLFSIQRAANGLGFDLVQSIPCHTCCDGFIFEIGEISKYVIP